MYDEQKDDRERIGVILLEQHEDRAQYQGPLEVTFGFYMKIPAKRNFTGRYWHTSRPDCDNLQKFILDILVCESIIRDDSQVCRIIAEKIYDPCPRTEFIIKELEHDKKF